LVEQDNLIEDTVIMEPIYDEVLLQH
jgi:hypothetical protein